jgi:hypothetical protein
VPRKPALEFGGGGYLVISAFKIWREQRRIQSLMDEISASYDKEMDKAKAGKASDDAFERISHDHHYEQKLAEDELNKLMHEYLVRQANRLLVPVPPFEDKGGAWMESSLRGGWHLTPEAMHVLRAAIRAERRARREEWLMWVPLLALVVGVISSVTALVAVVTK